MEMPEEIFSADEVPETNGTSDAQAEGRTRGQSLLETRNKKMAELFQGHRYKVEREVHLEPGQVFKTPFGHKGRHGFVLIEVDTDGTVAQPENKFIVGASVLQVAHDDYQALHGGLPENFGKSARKVKAEAAATEASQEPEPANA